MTASLSRKAESIGDKIARTLKEAIVEGAIGLGETLSEDTLAETFGVSRTPVREALRKLEIQGLVDIVPKSATRVFQPTLDQIVELTEFRFTIESSAAELAYARHRESVAKRLSEIVESMSRCVNAGDTKSYGAADTRFHESFYAHCDNRYLVSTYELNLAQVAALRTHLASNSEHEPSRSFREHQMIRDIFVDGDGEQLKELLRAHILRTRENYTNALAQQRQLGEETRIDYLRRVLVNGTQAETGTVPVP
ncbi:GntR family transcriptional regulator [Arthrobacter sulfonylureivorans]|uniref:GntR family transcriptional regulator n=1 Tax=Arthrobacter sulfonylureivorans TaxID=2486855 RepID=UPI0039E40E20